MSKYLFAYDPDLIEKKALLDEGRRLYRSGVISDSQWDTILREYHSQLYTPSIVMSVVLFITSSLGIIVGTVWIAMGADDGFRLMAVLLGVGLVAFVEVVLIKNKNHFHSGFTESGIYIGVSLFAFGLLGFTSNQIVVLLVGFTLSTIVALRYFDIIAFLVSIGFFSYTLFYMLSQIGAPFTAIMPFMFMFVFGLIYWLSIKLHKHISTVVFNKQFSIIKSVSLVMVYLAINHFIVSKLSLNLMRIDLSEHGLRPFAMLYYALSIVIPLVYLFWGMKKKSISIIRIGTSASLLSVLMFQYYLFSEFTMLSAFVWGLLLISVSLGLFHYLKQDRNGFTSEALLHEDWISSDSFALIASQSLGGDTLSNTSVDTQSFKGQGGTGGGAGASGTW